MPDPASPTPRRGRAALIAAGLFVVLAWPVIFSGFVRGRGAFDQLNYHEQVVRRFAEELPGLDYSNYLSATTPGYHTVLAVVARVVGDGRVVLQLVGSLFTVALVGLLAWGVSGERDGDGRRAPVARARGSTALVLPVVVSMPVYYAGVWMLPDNAGWLGVLGVLLIALRPRFDWVTAALGGLALALLVFVRQIHIWPMAMLVTAAWLGGRGNDDGGFDLGLDVRSLLSGVPAGVARVAVTLAACVPAAGVLVWFYVLWGRQLTPPVFTERHTGGNPTAPAFVLAVLGLYGVAFLPFVCDGLRRLWVRQTWLLALAVVVSLGLALAAPSTRHYLAGRYSGLWEVARHLPAPGGRSVLIVPLTVLGGVVLTAWFVSLGRRDRWVMLSAMAAFIAAQCASYKLWQRYTEPMVLVWLALAAARVGPARSAAGRTWRAIGPGVLALGLAAVTGASLWRAGPVKPRELRLPGEPAAPMLPGMVPGGREDRDRVDGVAPSVRSSVGGSHGRSPGGSGA